MVTNSTLPRFRKTETNIFLCVLLTVVFLMPGFASAYSVQQLSLGPRGDFILEPGKTEIFLKPGETTVKNISITSRIEGVSHFSIGIEDFTGSHDASRAVVLLGDAEGPYSLRDYLKPEITEFSLELGEKITIPVEVSIPDDAEPGGVYGAVLIKSDPRDSGDGSGQAKVVSRLGSLFLVKIEGDAKEEGSVLDFRAKSPQRWFYERGPIYFEILFENTGSVHLVPYGDIQIYNTFGTLVDDLPINAYFALPDSLRFREVQWPQETLLGRYTAKLSMNPGYGDDNEIREISFWVLPWKVVLGSFVGLFFVIYLFYFIGSRFEFKRKRGE